MTLLQLGCLRTGPRGEIDQVGARREVVSAAGEDDRTRLEIVVERPRNVGEFQNQLAIEGVQILVAVEFHQRDRPASLYRDVTI